MKGGNWLDLEVKHLKYGEPIEVIPLPPKSEHEIISNAARLRPIHIPRDVIVWHWTKFWENTFV